MLYKHHNIYHEEMNEIRRENIGIILDCFAPDFKNLSLIISLLSITRTNFQFSSANK